MKQKSVAGLARLRIVALTVFALSCVFCGGQALAGTKLVVDDGRFQGTTWVSQLAVTADDRFLIVSDFKNGVRTYDITTGTLVNSLVGHSLEGDSYFDAKNNILLTTGDRKVKVWDFQQQKLIKTITQGFHSQFMVHGYIDSKKKYVFAQNVKYSFDTKRPVKRYNFRGTTREMYDADKLIDVCFYNDRYYMFNTKIGEVKVFDCFSDVLITTYRLDNYQPGTYNYFDYRNGKLFISYKDGVRIVDIESGTFRLRRLRPVQSFRYISLLLRHIGGRQLPYCRRRKNGAGGAEEKRCQQGFRQQYPGSAAPESGRE